MAGMWQSVKQWFGLEETPETLAAQAHYEWCVNQARRPYWYNEAHVPDTLDGRFEMILLHVSVMQERLIVAEPQAQALLVQRALSERFFRDMDRSLREIGVSDTGVGKRIKKMAEAYFGRLQSYHKARDAMTQDSGASWRDALLRNVYGTVKDEAEKDAGLPKLLAGLDAWYGRLAQLPDAACLSAQRENIAA